MLTKTATVTVIPAVEARDFRAATHVCYDNPPDGTGGDTDVPDPPPAPDPTNPVDGTPILLETPDGSGGYDSTESIAPAPPGYVCREEVVWIIELGSAEPAKIYHVVCTLPE